MLTNIQTRKIDHLFQVLDRDKNKILETDDFMIVGKKISEMLGFDDGTRERKVVLLKSNRLFISLLSDLNKSEPQVSPEEWRAFFEHQLVSEGSGTILNNYIHRSVSYIFDLFDLNGDKFISKDEYLNMLRTYGLSEENCNKSFESLDKNDDHLISKEELLHGFDDYFKSSDENASGNWIFGDWQKETQFS